MAAPHRARSVCGALTAAFIFQGCSESSPVGSDERHFGPIAGRTVAREPWQPAGVEKFEPNDVDVAPQLSRLKNGGADRSQVRSGGPTVEISQVASATPLAQDQTEEPPPWLGELLHAPDPNVRIQALDAWARQPRASLDGLTYALVDSDESVRGRAQEVLEQELARR